MSTQNLKLEVLLDIINKATAPLKAITKGSSATSKALKETRDQLKALNQQQKKVDGFRKMDKEVKAASAALNTAQDRIKQIKHAMAAVEAPTKAMNRQFNKAVKEARALKQQHTSLIIKEQRLRTELTGAGMDTKNLASHQRKLKADMAATTASVNKQTAALKRQSDIAKRMNSAKWQRDNALQKRDKLMGAGARTGAAGVVMGLPILKTVKDFTAAESASVGLAKQFDGAYDSSNKLTSEFKALQNELQGLAETTPGTTLDMYALAEGGARMGIQGRKNIAIFTKQSAMAASAFQLPAEGLSENLAMISKLFKLPIDRIGELGDTINWLDDRTESKGGDIIDVMKRIGGSAEMVGMKYREAAALGSTFLSLGARRQIAATAANAMIRELAIATMQPAKFMEGLDMVGMKAQKVQTGMAKNATETIISVLTEIKKLPKEKQIEASTRIFGKDFGKQASKLAGNIAEYRKQLKLVNGEQAKGSMQKEVGRQNDTLAAQWENLTDAIFNTDASLGETLKPTLIDIITTIKDVVIGVRSWVKEHPVLAGFIMKTAAAVAILTIGVGALMLAIAAIMGPLILMRFGFKLLGIKSLGVTKALGWVRAAIVGIGRALLMNPIGLAITAIAVGAFLVYKYWRPIKAFFIDLWQSITASFNAFIDPIMASIKAVQRFTGSSPAFAGVPAMSNQMAPLDKDKLNLGKYRVKASKVSPIRSGASTVIGDTTNHYTINPSPDMDENQFAQKVAYEIEKNDRTKLASARSTLRDRE